MKTFRRIVLWALLVLALAATVGWFNLDKETRGLLKTFPTNRDLLFWNEAQRDAAFRALDRIPLLAKWHTIAPGSAPRALLVTWSTLIVPCALTVRCTLTTHCCPRWPSLSMKLSGGRPS